MKIAVIFVTFIGLILGNSTSLSNATYYYSTIYVPVTITAYTPRPQECDSTPYTTAFMTKVREGIVGLSRDLESDFGFKHSDEITLHGFGTFVFEDRMNKRWKRRVDVFMFSLKEARQFGKQNSFILINPIKKLSNQDDLSSSQLIFQNPI
jgi:3D (Asp-Asp-Asp) domain-containing protein